ncbi:MAG TPA: hypothetical protein VFD40_00295 [Candidatus Paceibacterota bacterium]|nr:hypothetical protein [Candidatus Paceibacterota bacterium]
MEKTELELIRERIQVKKEQLDQQGFSVPEEKELVAEIINERMEDSLKEMPPGMDVIKPDSEMKVPFPSQIVSQTDKSDKSFDSIIEEANIKLSELVIIAMEKSIPKAVKIALKSGNAFLIDKLRDSLADKYYQELKNKKLI